MRLRYPRCCPLQLDAGKASALALALELGATVLLDELRGRRVAGEFVILVMGLCGLLVAKRQSLIPAVVPLLQQARAAGYFLSDELLRQIRRLADE